nr:hypothetical protein [Actibacterium sp. 188UL27-1]
MAEPDWAGLDLREALYRRRHVRVSEPEERKVILYEVPRDQAFAEAPAPVLSSYLDVVVQGYLRLGGEAAVDGFFNSTMGWSRIQDDRAAPIYPGHQSLTREEWALVDRHAARVS